MDKKKQMNFNLNNFLLATTDILDYRDCELNNTTKNHSKRVAYVALKIGEQLKLEPKMMFSLCAYSLFHNYIDRDNCVVLNIFDDTGLLTKIVDFSHHIDQTYNIDKNFISTNSNGMYTQHMEDIFLEISKPMSFWLDLQCENSIIQYIYSALYDFTIQPTFEEVLTITSIFGNLYEDITPLLEKCEIMADFYHFEHKDKMTFLISASMLNFGKLAIPTKLLNSESELTLAQLEEIKANVYYNQKALSSIYGFDDISKWATKHHEKLNGEGYPNSLNTSELSLKDRLMSCLNIYNALTSNKSYRKKYTSSEAIDIMNIMSSNNEIDLAIVNDINNQLRQ